MEESKTQPPTQMTAGLFAANLFMMIFALGGVMLAQTFYSSMVQRGQCYDYARAQNLPDIEHLEFKEVVIASNQFRGHVCRFTDTRSNSPVSLDFAEADIPYGTDTLQVLCMVGAFLIFALLGWGIWSAGKTAFQRRRTHTR